MVGYGGKDLQKRKVLSLEWKSEGVMDDESGESMEPMEEVPLIELGEAELERLVRGWRRGVRGWRDHRSCDVNSQLKERGHEGAWGTPKAPAAAPPLQKSWIRHWLTNWLVILKTIFPATLLALYWRH